MHSEQKTLAQEPSLSSPHPGSGKGGIGLGARTGHLAMAGLLALTPAAAPIVAFAETPETPPLLRNRERRPHGG